MPYRLNTKWRALNAPGFGKEVIDFNRRLKERLIVEKKTRLFKQRLYIRQVMRRFQDLDCEYLAEKFPETDVREEKADLEDNLYQYRGVHFHRALYDNRKSE